jgi:predicted transcriptional regulator
VGGVLLASVASYVVPSAALMKDTTVSFKIDQALKAKLVALAKAENRTLSNFIEKTLKEEIAKRESKHGRMRQG